MGKNKLKKFAELEGMDCVFQYPREKILSEGFPYRGAWHRDVFTNLNPIVVELGCGKGEYTVALAKAFPAKNFVGIDIKGARIWSGAKTIESEKIPNARFLRTEIENIEEFFGSGEITEIWITFPDPQMQKSRKRLTSTGFLKKYRNVMNETGKIHLKTDSPFLFEYTRRLIELNGLPVDEITADLYGEGKADPVKSIRTFYEDQWLSRGKSIKLISFRIPEGKPLQEPREDDIEKDDYRAYTRHTVSGNT